MQKPASIPRSRIILVSLLGVLTIIPFGSFTTTRFHADILGLTLFILATSTFFYGVFALILKCNGIFQFLWGLSNRLLRLWFSIPTRQLLLGTCVAYVVIGVCFSFATHRLVPIIDDSQAQYAQGRMVSEGHLTGPERPFPEFFLITNSVNFNGHWFSQYPPGQVMFLAFGHLVGMPWIINPILGALTLLAMFFLARECFGEKTARLSLLLGFFCVQLLLMSSEYMNHTPALLFATVFFLFYARLHRTASANNGLLAGIALALMLLFRPYSAFAISLPLAVHGAWWVMRQPRKFFLPLSMIILCVLAGFSVQLWYNALTTGDPLLYGYVASYDKSVLPHFGVTYRGWEHSWFRGLGNISNNAVALNFFLFFWPIPNLIFVFVALLSPPRNRWFLLLLSVCLSLFVLYAPYFFQDIMLGARYMHEAIAPLIIISAIGIRRTPSIFHRIVKPPQALPQIRKQMQVALFLMTVYGLGLCVTLTVQGLTAPSPDQELLTLRNRIHDRKILVFTKLYDQIGYIYPQDLTAPVIFARDLEEKNRQLIAAFPDRTPYTARGAELFDLQGNKMVPP